MASFGRGVPRFELTPEEEDLVDDLSNLMSFNDSLNERRISLHASVVIPAGGRRRPLRNIIDYKIPGFGMEHDPDSQSPQKRVGKGRSRLCHKPRDRPLNLGLNQEFGMYDRLPCSDSDLQFLSQESRESDVGHRQPYLPKMDKEICYSNLSVRPKARMPNFHPFEAMASNGYGVSLHSTSSSSSNHHGIDGQFFNSSNNSYDEGNYHRNTSVEPRITNGYGVESSHLVPVLDKYHFEQFQDYDEMPPSTALNSSNGLACLKDVHESISSLPKPKDSNHTLIDADISSDVDKDESYLSDRKCSTPLSFHSDIVQPSSVSASSTVNCQSANVKRDISAQYAQNNGTKSSGVPVIPKKCLTSSAPPKSDFLPMPNSAHDWWVDSGDQENNEMKLPSANWPPSNAQYNDMVDANLSNFSRESPDKGFQGFNNSFINQCKTGPPGFEETAGSIGSAGFDKAANNMESSGVQEAESNIRPPVSGFEEKAKEQQVLDCGVKPNLSVRRKPKLASYDHVQEFQPKNPYIPRKLKLGWGETSDRNSLGSHIGQCQPPMHSYMPTTSSIHTVVSAHGNSNDLFDSYCVNALMKPTTAPAPIFSMDDDFPALQQSQKDKVAIASPTIKNDNWAMWRDVKEESPFNSPKNATPEEPQLNDFDQHSILIENLPPNSEDILREFLEAFGKIHRFMVRSTNTGHVAYVRLENDQHCEWIIDCFDNHIPGIDWKAPLKIKKLD